MSQLMQVTVPPNCRPGQLIQIQAPSGQVMQVQIPAGCHPGTMFQVQMPGSPAAPAASPPQQLQPNVKQLFLAVDTDQSGQIDATELQLALSSGGYHQFARRTATLLIRMYDNSRTGTISLPDFQRLWAALTQWRASFDMFDTDRSGSIDVGELATALGACGYKLSTPVVQLMMRQHDADGSGTISFDEYIQLNVELSICTSAFSKRDTQRIGRITLSYEDFITLLLESRV